MFSILLRRSPVVLLRFPTIPSRNFQIYKPKQTNLNVTRLLDAISASSSNNGTTSKASNVISKTSKNIKTTKRKKKAKLAILLDDARIQSESPVKTGKGSKRKQQQQQTAALTLEEPLVNVLSQIDIDFDCDTPIDLFNELELDKFNENFSTNKEYSPIAHEHPDNSEYEFDDAYLAKRNLQSYIHVCIFHDNLSEAHLVLLDFISKFSRSVTTADIENCVELLCKGWARKGSTENVRELFEFSRNELQLKPNINFYEYHLLSLAKQIRTLNREDIEQVLQQLRSDGHSPEQLFYRSTLNCAEIRSIREMFRKHNIQIFYRSYHYPRYSENIHVNAINALPQKRYDPFEDVLLENMAELVEQQFASEKSSVIKVVPIETRFYDTQEKKPEVFYKELIAKFEVDWQEALTKGFEMYLKKIPNKKLNGVPFRDFMTILPRQTYVNLMMDEIRKCASFSEHYSPFAGNLFETLGRKVMQQYMLQSNTNDHTLQDFRKCYDQYVKYTQEPSLIQRYNPREYWQNLIENGYHYYFDETKVWPQVILKEIGKDLYEIISNEAQFDSFAMGYLQDERKSTVQPVLSFVYKNHETYKTKMEIRVHPLLIRLYEGASSDIHFESERLPMLSPPVPWIGPTFGGNLLVRNFIVRTPQYYPKQRFKKLQQSQMYPTYDSLNALSLCPWNINEDILDLAIEIFKNKGNPELDIPVSLSYFGPLPRASSDMTAKEKAQVYHKRKAQKKEQAEMYSLWVDCLYKLSIGNHLRKSVFWFPINTDFRSRVYPVPPNFNHLGSDLSRSLLVFAKGKPLGRDGLKWLKIHLINLTGLKKRCSSEERLAYCDEIIDLIMDSADNPLDGQKWWMESDEKWQTLSSCIELTKAIRSGDPENYVSHIPIHQDGSCNGLQHYAALGRDVLGAKSVNLAPAPLPQDVYSDVAALVEADIDRDYANNIEIAKVVRGCISRKIVKQTVMTYVYGVTKYGAKLQVLKRLKEDSKFPEQHKVTAALYISEKIFMSIRRMFTQTREIQDWLTNCAQIISNDYGTTVEWVTPIGFPVIQSYYKQPRKNSGTKLLYPNTMKQKNAFPANFIHSLDSTHMMLTSLECHRNGLSFASVHDCYWTHARDIDQMNLFCRKQFVALHSEPVLDNLAVFLCELIQQHNEYKKIPNHQDYLKAIDQRIPKGEFDLNSVMESEFFFS